MEDNTNQNNLPENLSNQSISIKLSLEDLKNLAGWATFKAVIDIIAGALACIGIITAAYGIPQIIAGIRLLGATDELKKYLASNDMQKIASTFINLQKYFKLIGISIIIKICFIILGIILYSVLIAFVISYVPNIFNNMPNTYFQ